SHEVDETQCSRCIARRVLDKEPVVAGVGHGVEKLGSYDDDCCKSDLLGPEKTCKDDRTDECGRLSKRQGDKIDLPSAPLHRRRLHALPLFTRLESVHSCPPVIIEGVN